MARIKVGLVYGGQSVEHGVSIRSARNIETHINRELFDVFPIGIAKTGSWRYTKTVSDTIEQGEELQLKLNPTSPLFISPSGTTLSIDIILAILHGTHGEDGNIQGLLNSVGIPIVGSNVLGSALAMSKLVSKKLLQQAGVPVAPFLYYCFRERKQIRFDTIRSKLGLPFMVKAANLGSSVGISRVDKEEDLADALADSFRYDREIIIEQYIKGQEIECAVLGNHPPTASSPGEVIISKAHRFYTFDAKYMDPNAVRIDVPAKLNTADVNRIKALSVHAFQILQCNDFARVDLFLSHDGCLYVNEVNTIPGFTDASMFPLMWAYEGISFCDLITRLVQLTIQRYKDANNVVTEFNPTSTGNHPSPYSA